MYLDKQTAVELIGGMPDEYIISIVNDRGNEMSVEFACGVDAARRRVDYLVEEQRTIPEERGRNLRVRARNHRGNVAFSIAI